MEATTQSHRRMLRRICTLGRIAGWAMIVVGGLGLIGLGAYVLFGAAVDMHSVLVSSAEVVGQILTGLVVLVMVQFIAYVVEEDSEPRWLLRNAHVILCVLAFSLLLTSGLRSWPQGWANLELIFGLSPDQMVPMDRRLMLAFGQFEVYLPVFTKVLCVLGIAAIMRTVLPVLAESKTLA